MATIPTGRYRLVNVKSGNVAVLPDPNDGSPVIASTEDGSTAERWNVNALSNGKYTFSNVGQNMYAWLGPRAPLNAELQGSSQTQSYEVRETRVKGQFTISTTDSKLHWGFVDSETGTAVSLSDKATDTRNHWKFDRV